MKKGKFYKRDKPNDDSSNLFKTVTDKHAPIKKRQKNSEKLS